MENNKKIRCLKCDKELVSERADFDYLGNEFFTDVLRCPSCGAIFIPEELVRGRMAKVEEQLEDK